MKRRRTAFNHLAVIGRRFGACGASGVNLVVPVPSNLIAVRGDESVSLTWDCETVPGWNVYRDGVLVGSVGTRAFSESGLSVGVEYDYEVRANTGSAEGVGATLTVTTPGDPTKYKTTIKSWTADKRWLYCMAQPFTAANNQRLRLDTATGWTAGVYTNTLNQPSYNVGEATNQSILYYDTSPAATPGLTGGKGFIISEFYTKQVICYGNSITLGVGTTAANYYPKQLLDLYIADNKPRVYPANYGTPGYTTQQLIDNSAATLALYNATRYLKNVAVIWEITNDLYFGGTAAGAYGRFKTLCSLYKAAGFQVVVATVLPRSNSGTPGTFEADRQTCNTSIRNETLGVYWDAVYDIAADSRIGDAGDEANPTYYAADLVHLNATGYGIVAAGFKAVLDMLL